MSYNCPFCDKLLEEDEEHTDCPNIKNMEKWLRKERAKKEIEEIENMFPLPKDGLFSLFFYIIVVASIMCMIWWVVLNEQTKYELWSAFMNFLF